jgi:hypothetical protein
VEIEEAVEEFEKNVKMETSISNVSGATLWVVDESREYLLNMPVCFPCILLLT